MTGDRYDSLKKKYDELLKENEHLRAKVSKLESLKDFGTSLKTKPVQSTQSKHENDFHPDLKSVSSSENNVICDTGSINKYSPTNEKISLFMSLFKGRGVLAI